MIFGKGLEQQILETISRHMKGKKIIRGSPYGFSTGKSCSNNLMSFSDEMTNLMDKGRAVGIANLDFIKYL